MDLSKQLTSVLPASRVSTREIDRIAFANDASVYRLVPRAVVHPVSIDEIRALFSWSQKSGISLTFRAAGTSLSGQAVTDAVLVVLSRGWREHEILDGGERIRLQPGLIGGMANQYLRPYGRKIGPDPASINACMIGGILANNSSGMCCGVEQNAYHTLDSIRFVLPDGTLVDTSRPDVEERFRFEAPQIAAGIERLAARVREDLPLREKIERKYRLKNTMGYSLNALLDFDSPAQQLAHLMIGSEGTLGFIAEATLRTVPDAAFKYTGLLFFDDIPQACSAIEPLKRSGARALELMDRPSLRAVEGQPGLPAQVRELPAEAAALLVEYQCEDEKDRDACRRRCDELLPTLPLSGPAEWTIDPERQAALWTVRKGLIPSVGAMRARGTSFIIEDIVFPVERLAAGVAELQHLFRRWDYREAILFGHAKDGNLHFVLTQAFDQAADIRRYDGFMRELAELVAVRYEGALKAEHGTGRNMAPFVETEWGASAVAIMRDLKALIDPGHRLNPGVILNDNPEAHITNLKELPQVEAEIDRCIECGFCERWCPSRDLTLTPRQRIVVRREMARLRRTDPSSERLARLEEDWKYAAEETCATDGLCALACPVSIDTGQLTKRLRRRRHGEGEDRFACWTVDRFAWLERLGRIGLRAGHLLERSMGSERLQRWSRGLGVPGWVPPMPPVATPLRRVSRPASVDAVFFPSCVSRVLGEFGADSAPGATVERVASRAGLNVWTPADAEGLCCGMPFASKGFEPAYRKALNATVAALWEWTEHGRVPVVADASPCALTFKHGLAALHHENRKRYARMEFLDGIEFAVDRLLPLLSPERLDRRIVLHPACSVRKMGLTAKFQLLGAACAKEVSVPVTAGCCGMAGDVGFRIPELADAANAPLVDELNRSECEGFFSSSRSCEAGLRRVTGRNYVSFWRLLGDATALRTDRQCYDRRTSQATYDPSSPR